MFEGWCGEMQRAVLSCTKKSLRNQGVSRLKISGKRERRKHYRRDTTEATAVAESRQTAGDTGELRDQKVSGLGEKSGKKTYREKQDLEK